MHIWAPRLAQLRACLVEGVFFNDLYIRTEVSMALCPSELTLGRCSLTCPDVKAGKAQWWNVHTVGQ